MAGNPRTGAKPQKLVSDAGAGGAPDGGVSTKTGQGVSRTEKGPIAHSCSGVGVGLILVIFVVTLWWMIRDSHKKRN